LSGWLLAGSIVPPRVSLVLINFNYARYIGAAIEAIKAQDYPAFDCIIVDNGSTDNSLEVAARSIGKDARFRTIALQENLGQLGAFLQVLETLDSTFVTIVDADDLLAANYVSAHVQVHLAVPQTVGFTSSNAVEIDSDGRVIARRYANFGNGQDDLRRALSPAENVPRLAQISDPDYGRLSAAVSTVPATRDGWFWGPGTSNMYRRSILDLVRQKRRDPHYMRAVDSYLNPLCHALAGSTLIDLPLSAYRLHGSNDFAAHESVPGLRTGRAGSEALMEKERRETIEFVLARAEHFSGVVGRVRFWSIIDQLTNNPNPSYFAHPAIQTAFAENLPSLIAIFGEKATYAELFRRYRSRPLKALIRQAHDGRIPLRLSLAILAASARRRMKAMRNGVPPNGPTGTPAPGRNILQPVEPRARLLDGDRTGFGPAAILSHSPPVFMTGIAFGELLGIAPAFARRYGNIPAGFLIYPTWTIEDAHRIATISVVANDYRRRYPQHRLQFITNTAEEAERLGAAGQRAIFLNKNCTVSEEIFRPLPDAAKEFDAVYNSRFVDLKRHELAAEIENVAYLTYLDGSPAEMADQRDCMAAVLARNPRHVLLNPMSNGRPVRLLPDETNAALNLAAVGLCLSAKEGSNWASMEYMLAGLPVVSTPSTGGRDVFFDRDYCIICEPAAKAVREAVEELNARNIPPDLIRQRTLAKIEPERRRFLQVLDDMVVQLGGKPGPKRPWPFAAVSGIVTWSEYEDHLSDFEGQIFDQARFDRAEAWMSELRDVQLQPAELRPIVRAIIARPKCSLLIFGAGNDAAFWERVNGEGVTAFVESDPTWRKRAQATLGKAQVHLVQYDTKVSQWASLLNAPDKLQLDLAEEVSGRRWDVILVDGPPGYDDTQPGRMRSIYTAARLVAPGGSVFVHDCDRPVEREYAARYLGDERLYIQASGRSLLNGYAF
jgi:uncharacterized protein (TIGR01627 family)